MDFRLKRLVVFAIVILVLMSLSAILVKIYPDLLWFSMVSYLGVYKKILITKIFLGFVVSLVFLTITLGNLYFLHRFPQPVSVLKSLMRFQLEGNLISTSEK